MEPLKEDVDALEQLLNDPEALDALPDAALEELVDIVKTVDRRMQVAQQKADHEAALDAHYARQIREAKAEAKRQEDKAAHEKRIAKAEELLRREREFDFSKGW